MPRPARRLALVLPALLVLLARCDTSFDVYEGTDAYFSVSGYLDALADTQWIRIEALQDSLLTSTAPLDADVTLTDVSDGRSVPLQDSLFRYFGGSLAYNFWTAAPLRPRGTYRLTLRRADGAASAVTVALPDSFPVPTYTLPPFSIPFACTTGIDIRGVDALAALQVVYDVPDSFRGGVRRVPVSYLEAATRTPEGFRVVIRWGTDLQAIGQTGVQLGDLLDLRALRVRVGSAGPTWPEDVDLETLALPEVISNVEHGVGFVGGVASHTVDVPLGTEREGSCLGQGE
jgi:hypothetical protein